VRLSGEKEAAAEVLQARLVIFLSFPKWGFGNALPWGDSVAWTRGERQRPPLELWSGWRSATYPHLVPSILNRRN